MVNIKDYKHKIHQSEFNPSVKFVILFDKSRMDLKVDLQFINDKLYCLYFLNNQYFELEDDILNQCIEDILDGNYMIDRKGKNKSIVVGSNQIHPERVGDESDFVTLYPQLPLVFERMKFGEKGRKGQALEK